MAWLEAQGLLIEAVDHALSGGHWQRAVQLIERIGDELLGQSATARLQQLIEALPAGVRSAHPQILLLQGQCARQVWDIEAARKLFEHAAEAFGAAGNMAGRGESLIYLADCYRMLGAPAESRAALAQALEGPLSPRRRALALRSRAYEASATGNWEAASSYLDQALGLAEQASDQQALQELAVSLRGNLIVLPGGAASIERLLRLLSRTPSAPLSLERATYHFLSGMARLIRGDLPAAHDHLRQAMGLTEQLGALSQLSLETVLWFARCAALAQDFASAEQYADRVLALLDHPTLAALRQGWGRSIWRRRLGRTGLQATTIRPALSSTR